MQRLGLLAPPAAALVVAVASRGLEQLEPALGEDEAPAGYAHDLHGAVVHVESEVVLEVPGKPGGEGPRGKLGLC
ncbi:hypothetical protein MAPG_12016 [Magnaporthiopsis poae ATCC 64411]|uniref:Uncharacterized protein n=1 Tax=Magnaporthiopsis poae (strain ATCC 64411 / 73-15) TaxID=644358 RepID=A0A0C4EGN8_MAGP6|nr:hypothetical protein MAPG_12016 [Magnaporthiopsis poae ATCC 64411]